MFAPCKNSEMGKAMLSRTEYDDTSSDAKQQIRQVVHQSPSSTIRQQPLWVFSRFHSGQTKLCARPAWWSRLPPSLAFPSLFLNCTAIVAACQGVCPTGYIFNKFMFVSSENERFLVKGRPAGKIAETRRMIENDATVDRDNHTKVDNHILGVECVYVIFIFIKFMWSALMLRDTRSMLEAHILVRCSLYFVYLYLFVLTFFFLSLICGLHNLVFVIFKCISKASRH